MNKLKYWEKGVEKELTGDLLERFLDYTKSLGHNYIE